MAGLPSVDAHDYLEGLWPIAVAASFAVFLIFLFEGFHGQEGGKSPALISLLRKSSQPVLKPLYSVILIFFIPSFHVPFIPFTCLCCDPLWHYCRDYTGESFEPDCFGCFPYPLLNSSLLLLFEFSYCYSPFI